jgi:CubicO group peptidase (beta-lactamase class C family)
MKNPSVAGFLALMLAFTITAPHLLADDLTPPADPSQPGPMAAALQPLVDQHSLVGAVTVVANRDKVLDLEAVGYSNLETKKPIQTTDLFWIASMGKAMAASTVMMLVDDGKLSLDDPVEKYLPEFSGQQVKTTQNGQPALVAPDRPILIRDLLSHTSGLPFSVPLESPTLDLSPLAERVRAYAKTPLNNQPGAHYDYSNAGINTAARVVEVVSGEKYEDFLSERLLKPLGMVDTTFFPTHEQLDRLVPSYITRDKLTFTPTVVTQLKYPLDGGGRFAVPAGGLFSTASDVAKFCQLLLNGGTMNGTRLLSEDAVHQMTTRQTPPSTGGSYGFGWMVNGDFYYHEGYYQTRMQVEPKLNLITILLVQHYGDWPNGKNPWDVVNDTAHKIGASP